MIEALRREQVEVIFGIPGVQIMGLLDTIYQTGTVRWITVRHEQTAAFMAFGYARTTGKPGVAMVVPGPGALNSTAAVGTAFAASTPLLLLTGQIDTPNIGKDRGVLHDFSRQPEVFETMTKWNHRITTVADIPGSVRTAMAKLLEGRPRPVQLEIPFDLWSAEDVVPLTKAPTAVKDRPNAAAIKQAARTLAEARFPVVWAGGGVTTSDAANKLKQLAEKLNAMVVMTPEGKGALSSAHPLCGGTADLESNPLIAKADVILCIGSRLLHLRDAKSKMTNRPTVVQIDIDAEEIGRNYEIDQGINSDARVAIETLIDELPLACNSEWDQSEIQSTNTAFTNRMKKGAPIQYGIIDDIRSELNEDAILVPGITNMGYWSRYIYPVYRPRTYITSSYFVTLGFAFPTALGAKVGNPEKQVVALSGDGGFLFAVGDLATAVKLNLNVVTIVFNDNVYGATYRMQLQKYENRIIGTDLQNPDFAALAESFGAVGMKLASYSELGPALRSALTKKGPVVIEVPIESMPHPWEVFRQS